MEREPSWWRELDFLTFSLGKWASGVMNKAMETSRENDRQREHPNTSPSLDPDGTARKRIKIVNGGSKRTLDELIFGHLPPDEMRRALLRLNKAVPVGSLRQLALHGLPDDFPKPSSGHYYEAVMAWLWAAHGKSQSLAAQNDGSSAEDDAGIQTVGSKQHNDQPMASVSASGEVVGSFTMADEHRRYTQYEGIGHLSITLGASWTMLIPFGPQMSGAC